MKPDPLAMRQADCLCLAKEKKLKDIPTTFQRNSHLWSSSVKR